jgi:hypothetical protein
MGTADALRALGVSRVLTSDQDGYAEAVAGFDLAVACTPDVLVDAREVRDVESTVAHAAARGETVTVLGSGHGRLHEVRDGLAISVRHLDTVVVDDVRRSARIGAGCSWVPVLTSSSAHGLAAPCGSAPGVGVVGYLLGGGLGPLASSFGFSSDHVRSFDVVTPADGAITVSADSHPDLYWAMRGGKGGFGVVTAVDLDLLDVTTVYGGGVYFSFDDAHEVLNAFSDWAPSLPASATTSVALLQLPASDALPDAIRGRHLVHLRFASIDAHGAAEARLGEMRAVAEPVLDTVGPLPYGSLGSIHGDPTQPMPVCNGTLSLHTLDAEAIDALLVVAGSDGGSVFSSIEIRTLGSATKSGVRGPDAVGGRSVPHILNIYAAPTADGDEAERIGSVRAALGAMAPWRAPVNLVNFVGRGNDADAFRQSWTVEQHRRLDSIRVAHDPDGLFAVVPHGGVTSRGSSPDSRAD